MVWVSVETLYLHTSPCTLSIGVTDFQHTSNSHNKHVFFQREFYTVQMQISKEEMIFYSNTKYFYRQRRRKAEENKMYFQMNSHNVNLLYRMPFWIYFSYLYLHITWKVLSCINIIFHSLNSTKKILKACQLRLTAIYDKTIYQSFNQSINFLNTKWSIVLPIILMINICMYKKRKII